MIVIWSVPGVYYCKEAARKSISTGHSTVELHTREGKPWPPDGILPKLDAKLFQFR